MATQEDFEHKTADQYGREILTLGKFRELTKDLDDEVQIVIDDGADWWDNVKMIGLPDTDLEAYESPYSAISLQPGGPIDSRQF
jgi:hypothetical protein